jgi:hypothetical protein
MKHLGWVVMLCAHPATQMLHPHNFPLQVGGLERERLIRYTVPNNMRFAEGAK